MEVLSREVWLLGSDVDLAVLDLRFDCKYGWVASNFCIVFDLLTDYVVEFLEEFLVIRNPFSIDSSHKVEEEGFYKLSHVCNLRVDLNLQGLCLLEVVDVVLQILEQVSGPETDILAGRVSHSNLTVFLCHYWILHIKVFLDQSSLCIRSELDYVAIWWVAAVKGTR